MKSPRFLATYVAYVGRMGAAESIVETITQDAALYSCFWRAVVAMGTKDLVIILDTRKDDPAELDIVARTHYRALPGASKLIVDATLSPANEAIEPTPGMPSTAFWLAVSFPGGVVVRAVHAFPEGTA